ncbi:LysR family transcriptional regulator [Burkholderia territorii]|uniref:LysR substrate-binding domain-containing protein n=1 Tax=Burkholderia territorii TaxID=1503055 RepID=UPI00075A22BE|nr:LysR substrate-binding domain-containing protein [Burkholderia territorii]AOI67814.1 LysR family transcriptional regulator [Burkholderia territorii]KUY87222.1 LysR family transcriptional regulator [Burkholderia territorii]KUZ07108.1 LysR family transcriptional regulator [Burkholderia territorii]KVK95574.1 LysR family transcriptional regulator [Burkholderia territorii]KVL26914.1 LysR family transcriptional regulator [Burkholderia territorii]
MKKLDLDVLAMVVAVTESGSFAQGAQAVHRSPSAVSMQIKALEDALGKPLFIRDTRNVTATDEGRMLADYGRRMLAMRDEAWASVVRPEIRGRVTIGVPDDYISSLLPQVLGKFAAMHPRVEVRVIGQPSSALVPMLKDNTIDLACLTRIKGVTGELVRLEPIVWTGSPKRNVWEERPLPVALFTHGSMARDHAIKALNRQKIPFRMSYESPSFLGLISMVEAGLAVAPLARCCIPEHLVQLSQNEGLPPLDALEVVLARSAQSARPPCDYLAEQILNEWRA